MKREERRWRVEYDLLYDYGGSGSGTSYYRTLMGAVVARWLNLRILSWGGTAFLIDQSLERRNDGRKD